jgi:hypothetical protein
MLRCGCGEANDATRLLQLMLRRPSLCDEVVCSSILSNDYCLKFLSKAIIKHFIRTQSFLSGNIDSLNSFEFAGFINDLLLSFSTDILSGFGSGNEDFISQQTVKNGSKRTQINDIGKDSIDYILELFNDADVQGNITLVAKKFHHLAEKRFWKTIIVTERVERLQKLVLFNGRRLERFLTSDATKFDFDVIVKSSALVGSLWEWIPQEKVRSLDVQLRPRCGEFMSTVEQMDWLKGLKLNFETTFVESDSFNLPSHLDSLAYHCSMRTEILQVPGNPTSLSFRQVVLAQVDFSNLSELRELSLDSIHRDGSVFSLDKLFQLRHCRSCRSVLNHRGYPTLSRTKQTSQCCLHCYL